MEKEIAFFDFDDTLVKGDSFWPFLIDVAGWPKTAWALLCGLFLWRWNQPVSGELRTFVKSHLIKSILKGKTVKELEPAAQKLRTWVRELPTAQTLRDHYNAGHRVVIASGGLDLYLPTLLSALPHHDLICTQIGVKDGVVTGEMISGNCVRQRKALLVQAYLDAHPGYSLTWGYGNYPHDVPMMKILDRRILV